MATDLVIVLSSDWVGSTATRAHLGEDTADAVQELHDTLLRRVIDDAGGQIIKHSGDGVLAIFHSATAALGAAVKIQRDFAAYRASPNALAPIDLRVGLAAGDVQHQSGDIFGLPVIEAVRLQSAAAPNEILCSDFVRVLSQGRGGFAFQDAGSLQLKGLPAPVRASKVHFAESTPASSAPTGSTRANMMSTPQRPAPLISRSTAFYSIAAALIVVLIVVGGRFLGREAPAADQVTAAEPPARQPGPPARSIAVIPFANLSPNEDDAYFSIGIHEQILSQLTKLGGLQVVARTTVQRYAATQKSISEIARELNVETVMEGSVRYADGRVVVTTQLINGATDAQLWSESYEREFSNIFAIQSDIALNVADALEARLLRTEREQVERVPTKSLQAYDLYLSAIAREGRDTLAEQLRGIEEIDEAIELDPDFALAWAQKASLHTRAQFVDAANSAEHQSLGIQAARRALELDPELGKAYVMLGFALTQINDWNGSEAAFLRALMLNVPVGDTSGYGVMQLAVGNFAYAREVLQEKRETVPQDPTALAFLVTANALLGDWATALAQYELGTRLFAPWPVGDSLMLLLRVAHNDLAEARAIRNVTPIGAAMVDNLDMPEAARRDLRRMYDDTALADGNSRREIAAWAAHFGDAAFALDAIRTSATQRGANLLWVWLPQFAEARKLPAFKLLMRDLGIVAYWQEYGFPAVCRQLDGDDFECD